MKKQFYFALVFAVAGAACASTSSLSKNGTAAAPESVDNDFREKQPVGGPIPEIHAPTPVRKVLANGLTVFAIQKAGLPLMHMQIVVRSGSAEDPESLPGTAGFVGDMLKSGTDKLSATALADEMEMRGASLNISADEDSISISSTALSNNFPTVFDLVADVAQHSAFSSKEVERVRKQRLAALQQIQDEPQRAADQVFRAVVYGNHPYGHTLLGNQKTIAKITAKQLKDYFARHFVPGNAAVIIVGDMTAEAAVAEVEKRFGQWHGNGASSPPPPDPQEQPAGISLVPRPGAPQSQLMIGHLGVSRADPDYYALVMCNAILGGLFNSRINMNLREDKGYTYGARSYFDFMRGKGPFFVATGVRTNATDLAIKEVLKEIEQMRDTNVSKDELTLAKSRYTLSLPGYFQTSAGISGMIANIYLFDLPLDYYQALPKNINAVAIEDVRRVAEKHLQADKLKIVVVGDKQMVEPGLGDLQRGPVQLRDTEGNVL